MSSNPFFNSSGKLSGVLLQKIFLGGALVLVTSAAFAETAATTAPAQTGGVSTSASSASSTAPATPAPDGAQLPYEATPETPDPNAAASTPAPPGASTDLPAPRLNNDTTPGTIVITPRDEHSSRATTTPRTNVTVTVPGSTASTRAASGPTVSVANNAPSAPVTASVTSLNIPKWRAARVSSLRRAAAWKFVERGTRAMKASNWNAALSNYQHAAKLDPNNPYALNGIADNLLILGRYPAAESAYRRALSRTPGNIKLLRGLAESALPQRKYGVTLTAYQQVLKKAPRDFVANYQSAQILTWTKQYSAADTYYRRALDASPRNAEAWAAWGESLSFARNARAADAFNRALQINPKFVRALVGLGNVHLWSNEYSPAMTAFGRVLAIEPRNVTALVGLGDALTFTSQPSDAIPHYRIALLSEPSNAQARLGLGRALVLARRESEAVPVLQQVLVRDPNNVEVLSLLADAQGESTPDVALTTLQRLLALQRAPHQRAQTLVKIARLQARGGDFSNARASYSSAIELAPLDTEIALSYAQALIARGEWGEAKRVVEEALRNDPSNTRALILQVATESKAGTPERANALATRALALNITDPRDALTLVNAMRAAGNREGASQVLNRLAEQANTVDSQQALEIATALRDAGMYDRAAPIYEDLLKADPKNGQVRFKYAEMLLWQREYDASQRQADALIADEPDNREARLLLATIALRRDAKSGADIAGREAATVLANDPRNTNALLLQTQVLSLRERYAEAVESARAALESEPDSLEARLALARNLHYAKRTPESIEQYRELIKRAPAEASIKLELAKVFLDENQLSDAEILYLQVLAQNGALLPPVAQSSNGVKVRAHARLNPTFLGTPRPLTTRADTSRTNARQGKLRRLTASGTDEAILTVPGPDTASTPAILLKPEEQIAANVGMGEVRRRQGRWAEATDYFNAALALDPADLDARLGLARTLRGQGDYTRSLDEAERILLADENNLGAKVLRAQVLADTGEATKAQQELDILVSDLPDKPSLETYLDLAAAFVEIRNYDAAIKLLQVAGQDYPNRVEVATRLGETYSFARRWDESLEIWNKLIELDPQDATAVRGKARVYNYSNRLPEAESNYRRVLELEPENYSGLTELADILARSSEYPDAIALYRQVIVSNPNDLKVRTELARVLRYNRNFTEAESVASGVLEVDPRYAPAYTERSLARSATGNYAAALVDARQAVEITPNDITAQLGLAEVLSYTKNYDESIRLYRAALARDPENTKARTELAAALSYAGKYDEALGELDVVLKANPRNLDAQVVKADTYARARRTKEARLLYQEILRQDSRNLRARVGLAEAYAYNRQYDDALKMYDELIALDPANPAYRIAKGRTLSYARRFPAALAILRPIVAANPNNVEARLALAEAMTNSTDNGLRREAVTIYQVILRQNPDNVDARIGLGRVYSYSGRYNEADREFNEVLKIYPDSTEARYALAESQRFAGHDFEARENYERVLKTQPQDIGAQAGYDTVRRTTSPSVTAAVHRYYDTNGVRIKGYSLGGLVPTRQGTIGLTGERGTFEDEGIRLRRRALTLLLARRFGSLQARLLLSKVNYSDAPSRTLYDLGVQRTYGPRKRIYVTLAKREVLESIEAVQDGITAKIFQIGGDYPLGKHFDASLDVTHYKYSDDNSRTAISPSLYYRFKEANPSLRLGVGYRRDNTREIGRPYYTPQDYNAFVLIADYVKNSGKFQYGIYAAHPITNSTGPNGENRPADTLFGFATYELSDLVDLFINGGTVRSPNFDSNEFTAGATVHF
jgi:tetratricopeptide (TPR) repeat protein